MGSLLGVRSQTKPNQTHQLLQKLKCKRIPCMGPSGLVAGMPACVIITQGIVTFSDLPENYQGTSPLSWPFCISKI